jgi:hypothetical protein
LVPIPAKLLAKANDVAKVKIFEYEFDLNLTLPFNWKILFFCSLSFVIANIIYAVFCPKLIKDHSNFSHFENEGKRFNQLYNYAKDMGYIAEDVKHEDDPMFAFEEKNLPKAFWNQFNYGNNVKHCYIRWISIFFYGLGFSLLGCLVYQNIIWVVKATFL